MNAIILYIGLGVFIIGGMGLLIAAFRTSIFWGLAVLFIAPIAIIYLIVHWQDARGPFKLQIFGVMIIAAAAYMNGGVKFPVSISSSLSSINISTPASINFPSPSSKNKQYQCDGRSYCSQMRSRAEAEFFVRNCPNTKMDGNHDGVPCEKDSRF